MARGLEQQRAKGIEASDWTPGTVADDVMTVHKVRDGKPLCGTSGEVDEWQRTVTCTACLSSE
ncbi:hypothetical protein ACWY4P_08740 [Streptomyces sp. LZ34]